MVCDDYNMENVSSAHSASQLEASGDGEADAAELMMASQQDMAAKFAPFSGALAHGDHLGVDYQHHDDLIPTNGDLVHDKGLDDASAAVHGTGVHGAPVHGAVHGAPVHGTPVHGAPVHGVHPSQLSQQILASTAARNHSATMTAMMLDSRLVSNLQQHRRCPLVY